MEFSGSTFILEIVNFLVLVWILKRLLYEPVRKAIEERRKAVEGLTAKAEEEKNNAQALEAKYENRLKDWEKEKESLRAGFEAEAEEIRKREEARLEADLEARREKSAAQDAARRKKEAESAEEDALRLAGKFASRILSRLSDRELEEKIVRIFVEEFPRTDPEKIRLLHDELSREGAACEIFTAFPLGGGMKDAVSRCLQKTIGVAVKLQYLENPALIAGLHCRLGPLAFDANLRDELQFFSSEGRN